jgi:hypothetical protein
MKNFFIKLLEKLRDLFKRVFPVRLPLWAYCAIVIGAYVAGYLVGKL